MAGPADTLREIHRLRRHAQNLRDEINRGPIMLKAQQTRVARQEEAVRQAQEALKQVKVAILQKESELKSTEQQIAKYEKQRNESTSKKEYDAFNHEIAACRTKIRELEDQILELMLQSDQKAAEIPELEKAIQQAQQEKAKLEASQEGRKAELTAQLQQAEQGIKEAEAQLPPDVLEPYRRLVAAKGHDALAPVKDRTCVTCYTAITAQSYNELILGNFVQCKSCGRILYLPE